MLKVYELYEISPNELCLKFIVPLCILKETKLCFLFSNSSFICLVGSYDSKKIRINVKQKEIVKLK